MSADGLDFLQAEVLMPELFMSNESFKTVEKDGQEIISTIDP